MENQQLQFSTNERSEDELSLTLSGVGRCWARPGKRVLLSLVGMSSGTVTTSLGTASFYCGAD